MTSLRFPLAAVLVVAPVVQAAAPAHAAANGFEDLRAAAGKGEVKIWSRWGAFTFDRAQFDSTGIWSTDASVYRPSRKAWIQTAEVDSAGRVPLPIAWEGVDSVAVVRDQGMSGALRAGLFVGGILVGMYSGVATGYLVYAGQDIGGAAWIPMVVAGLAIGVSIFGGGEQSEVVYRARD